MGVHVLAISPTGIKNSPFFFFDVVVMILNNVVEQNLISISSRGME